MPAEIPASLHDILADDRPLLAALSTINPDGQPHTVPVWFDFDGTNVRVNAPDTTRKARNMDIGTRVTVLVIDPKNDYHWVEVMGKVAEIYEDGDGGRDHINKLAQKYRGTPIYQAWHGKPENRVMYVIEPVKVNGM